MNQRGKGHSEDSGQQSHAKNTNEMEQTMGNPSQGLVLAPSSAQLPPMAMVETGGAQYSGTPLIYSYQLENEKREIEIRQRLKSFWDNQIKEIKKMGDIKNHCLPLARIKKIMKADEDVKMISCEVPMVFAKACEMFILELTLRSWYNTEENKRRTLLRSDVTLAITRTDIFDFLVDIIPREESSRDDSLYSLSRNAMPVAVPDAQAFYTMLPQNLAHPRTSAEIMNRPAVDPSLFRQHIPYMPPVYWYPQEQQQDHEEEQQQQQDQEEEQQQQPQPPPPSSASDS